MLSAWRGLFIAGALFLGGCVSVVTPPDGVEEPVTVYLYAEAMHKGVVLPRADGSFVEYGYGDWDWYALNKNSWYHVFDTVLWPTQGTLGRRFRRGVPASASFTPLVVPGTRMVALRASLDTQYRRAAGTQHLNAELGMTFVHHEDGYWFLYNCNDAVARWLRELDCEVSWVPIRLGLSVKRR